MLEVFLDTETTGLSYREGHKIVEIACIETEDLIATGRVFHKLINPKRNMPDQAYQIHGFSEKFLDDKEIAIAAIKNNTGAFLLLNKKLTMDKDILTLVGLEKHIKKGEK